MAQSSFKCPVPGCSTRTAKNGYRYFSGLQKHCEDKHSFSADDVHDLKSTHNLHDVVDDSSTIQGDGADMSSVQSQLESVTTEVQDLQDEVSDLKSYIETSAEMARQDAVKMDEKLNELLQVRIIELIFYLFIF